MILRDYQERAIAAVREHYRRGRKRVLLVGATGFGKTATASALMAASAQRGKRAIFLVHRREIVVDTATRLRALGLRTGVVMAGIEADLEAPVQVCSVQTVSARALQIQADLVVWDECFVSGTKIMTDRGSMPIESVRIEDRVVAFNEAAGRVEVRPVVRLFRSVPSALVRVRLQDGREFVCTPSHPFFTKGAWRVASELRSGDELFDLRSAGNWSQDVQQRMSPQVVVGANGDDESRASVRAHADAESDAERSCSGTHGDNAAYDRAQAEDARGEWSSDTRAAAEDDGGSCGVSSGLGVRGSDWAGREGARSFDALQDRRGDQGRDDRSGDRRRESLCVGAEGGRRSQDGVPAIARVDRVEVLEPGSDGRYGGLCPDGHVYNLEVEDAHTYFVDGVLVHNCHHVAAASYVRIREQYPQAWHLGLTATPMRADGAGLGDAFDDLVVAATTRELQERGFLVECDALVPQSAQGRDFATTAELAYHEHARARATVVFAATVARGREIATNLALPLIHGGTKTEERDACLRAFAQGETPGIVNVMVLTEGWDCARADTVILERNCGSVGMYLQIVGRVLRANPADASKRALLVDLGKNVRTHGLPSEDREFSLGDDPIKRKDKTTAPLCKLCGASRRPGAESCWRCKFVFPVAGPTKQIARDELVQYAPAMRVAMSAWSETKEVHLRGLEQTCAERNYKRGWVAHRFRNRWGHWPWEMEKAS